MKRQLQNWAYISESEVKGTLEIDFPVWMVHSLDREAKRLGVARQSLIRLRMASEEIATDKEGVPSSTSMTGTFALGGLGGAARSEVACLQ
jgi:hypothetical protein